MENGGGRRVPFWLFLYSLPLNMAAGALAVYAHEFAHGLTALAFGGHFVGLRGNLFTRAYADAWCDSESAHVAVMAAGIGVNVLIGFVLYRRAVRTEPVLPRLTLLSLAYVFLADLGYAFDGFLHASSEDYDSANILRFLDLPALRWIGAPLLFAAFALAFFLVSRRVWRAWEEIFGSFSLLRGVLILLFLAFPLPLPSARGPDAKLSLAFYVPLWLAIAVYLLARRRKDVAPVPLPRLGAWIGGVWLAGAAGIVAHAKLKEGIELSTYFETRVLDVRPGDRTVAGVAAEYGLADYRGENRPVRNMKLFVATPDGVETAPCPTEHPLHVSWHPDARAFLIASDGALYSLRHPLGAPETLWRTEKEAVRATAHGPDGETLLVGQTLLYAYDLRRRRGQDLSNGKTVGTPYFLSGSRARVSVGDQLWELRWEDDGIKTSVLLEGTSRWYEGSSGERHWWSETGGWSSDAARVSNAALLQWGAGEAGFYAVNQEGRWRLTTPLGQVTSEGDVRQADRAWLYFREGLPWLAWPDGRVRRLDDPAQSFHFRTPGP